MTTLSAYSLNDERLMMTVNEYGRNGGNSLQGVGGYYTFFYLPTYSL